MLEQRLPEVVPFFLSHKNRSDAEGAVKSTSASSQNLLVRMCVFCKYVHGCLLALISTWGKGFRVHDLGFRIHGFRLLTHVRIHGFRLLTPVRTWGHRHSYMRWRAMYVLLMCC